MPIQIQDIAVRDRARVAEIVQQFWRDQTVIVHGELFNTAELTGLKATLSGNIIGILHYQIREDECEIITLASLQSGLGAGSALVAATESLAREQKCRIFYLIITNDNLNALGFYLAALYPGQVDMARRRKPSIPEIGENNIPLRDELRLEKKLL